MMVKNPDSEGFVTNFLLCSIGNGNLIVGIASFWILHMENRFALCDKRSIFLALVIFDALLVHARLHYAE